MSGAAVSRKAQRTMLPVGDEGQNFRDRGVLGGQRLHLVQPFGKDAWSVKQLLIEGPYDCQSFAREIATLHADDVETLEAGILAVDEAERDHVVADLTVMTDVAAGHEISALADAGGTAPTARAGVHGHLFPDDAAPADLKLGEFAAIAQRLRRSAERNERIDRTAVADHGLRRDVNMRGQLAVRADDDVRADDAVGTD